MILGLLVLFTALSISAVAIYYSVAGLVAIFAAAAVPIMIMGSILEISKLVTAVWLHKYWNESKWWLKTYLSMAVLVLMLITSMGIFGFLSKAHIEQTATAQEGLAQIDQIVVEISRQEEIINSALTRITQAETRSSNTDQTIQEQIDREQARIDGAYERIQPAIDEQQAIIDNSLQEKQQRIQPLQDEIARIDANLLSLENSLASNDVRTVQGIVGVRQDGSLGPGTKREIDQYTSVNTARRIELLSQIDIIRTTNPQSVTDARAEISRLRSIAEQQIANSDKLIARLRDQLGSQDQALVDSEVVIQREIINQANLTIDSLNSQKFNFESEYRKLEAEVGPVKYLAEFIYGEAQDTDLLEQAVRWVILLIIFVFDPLAVLLLIASQYTIEQHKKLRREQLIKNEIDLEPKETKNDDIITRHDNDREIQNPQSGIPADNNSRISGNRDTEHSQETTSGPIRASDVASFYVGLQPVTESVISDQDLRQMEYDLMDQQLDFVTNKEAWKKDHPEETLKQYKTLFITGKIDKLPWEDYISNANTGYKQNGEQNDSTLFQRLKQRKAIED